MNDQLDLFLSGRDLANQGIEQSEQAQNRRSPAWSSYAYWAFLRFASEQTEPFTTEAVRAFAEGRGFEPAQNASAWGAVAAKAVRKGVVEFAGYRQSVNASRHLAPVRLWKRTESTKYGWS